MDNCAVSGNVARRGGGGEGWIVSSRKTGLADTGNGLAVLMDAQKTFCIVLKGSLQAGALSRDSVAASEGMDQTGYIANSMRRWIKETAEGVEMTKRVPFYDGTLRQWKTQKRGELKAVLRAFEIFRLGCAYLPNYQRVDEVGQQLEEIRHELSTKKWGR